jgi:uncharacterized protein (DUF736 family)
MEKHMMIGKFREHEDLYAGSLYGLGFAVPFVLFSPVPAKIGNGPDFIVMGAESEEEGDATGCAELGAAWSKTSKAGKPYLSVKLDSPVLVSPVNCALIRQQNGSHGLIWTREQPEETEAVA